MPDKYGKDPCVNRFRKQLQAFGIENSSRGLKYINHKIWVANVATVQQKRKMFHGNSNR